MENTISINHNWTNAFGVSYMWTHLQNELTLVSHLWLSLCCSLQDFIQVLPGGGGAGLRPHSH